MRGDKTRRETEGERGRAISCHGVLNTRYRWCEVPAKHLHPTCWSKRTTQFSWGHLDCRAQDNGTRNLQEPSSNTVLLRVNRSVSGPSGIILVRLWTLALYMMDEHAMLSLLGMPSEKSKERHKNSVKTRFPRHRVFFLYARAQNRNPVQGLAGCCISPTYSSSFLTHKPRR